MPGSATCGVVSSPIAGTHGNAEFIAHLDLPTAGGEQSDRMVEHREPTGGEPMTTSAERSILVVAHARRDDTVAAAERVVDGAARGRRPARALRRRPGRARRRSPVARATSRPSASTFRPTTIELAIVLGGDGTILRAAELVREGTAPVLGINMGHVGFLAEIERDDMDDAVQRVIARDYEVEERMALQVRVKDAADDVVYETWALNEATVEKASRERMLEVVIEIDGRPLSTFGCDGVVVSTPTGSTAYTFSRGRAGDLADRRGPRRGAAVGARAVRQAAGGRARARRRHRAARAHERHRRPLVRRPALARPARRAPASWCGAPSARCASPACTPRRSPTGWCASSDCPSTGWRGPAALTTERRAGRDRGDAPARSRRHRRGHAADRPRLHRHHGRDRCGQDDGRHRARPAARSAR